jgi:hypothetical protein
MEELNNIQKRRLKDCRFYKGEKECPAGFGQNERTLWFYESCWVHGGAAVDCIAEYEAYGLGDFCKDDPIPKGLKALLFNRYSMGSFSMESAVNGFKKLYKTYYYDKTL